MTRYTATFADHDLTRNSDREYTHAWIVTQNGRIIEKGFSGSAELANKAATATMPRAITEKSKFNCKRTHKLLAADNGLSLNAWYAERETSRKADIASRTIEVVAATAV